MKGKWIGFALAAGLAACAAPRDVRIIDTATGSATRADPRLEEWRREAACLFARESYGALKKAFALYGEIEAAAGAGAVADEKHLWSALLLAARSAELGIREPAYAETAARLIRANPAWSGYEPFLRLVGLLPINTAGIFDDGPAAEDPSPAVQAIKKDEARLFAAADDDPAPAYLGALCTRLFRDRSRSRWSGPGCCGGFPGAWL